MVKQKVRIEFDAKTEKDLEIIKDLKQYYDIIYKCSSCGTIYGSQSKKDNGICVTCIKNLRKSKMELRK